MSQNWTEMVRHYRVRHGLSQHRMAALMGVSQRTISRWERGEDNPSLVQQKRLLDLGWEPSSAFMRGIAAAVLHCPAPRALTRTESLKLELLSPSALAKRPSMANHVGHALAPIACGILQEILDDAPLQKAISSGEIATLVTTTRSCFQTIEHARIGVFNTTVTFFFHEGDLYSDAIGFPAPEDTPLGYTSVARESIAYALR